MGGLGSRAAQTRELIPRVAAASSVNEPNALMQLARAAIRVTSLGRCAESPLCRRQNVSRPPNWNEREPLAPVIRPKSALLMRSSGLL